MNPKLEALDIHALQIALAKSDSARVAVQDVADELGIVQAVMSKATTGVDSLSSDAIAAVARTSLLQARLVVVSTVLAGVNQTLEAELTQIVRAGSTT